MTSKVRRELRWLRALAKARRAAAFEAHRARLTSATSTTRAHANAGKG